MVTAAVALVLVVASIAAWMRQSACGQTLAGLLDLPVVVEVISSNRHTVKPWFQGKLPSTFSLPELENSRSLWSMAEPCIFERSRGVQLLFGLHNHQLSVFSLPATPGKDPTADRRRHGAADGF